MLAGETIDLRDARAAKCVGSGFILNLRADDNALLRKGFDGALHVVVALLDNNFVTMALRVAPNGARFGETVIEPPTGCNLLADEEAQGKS